MTIKEKLEILADAAKYDASCSSSGSYRKRDISGFGNTEGMGICHSYTPDGRCVSLLKILLTNFCIYDCKFCINRVSSDTKRARFTVEEVVWLTVQFYRRNYIEGLFLSSGIVDSVDSTMDRLTEVARKLREEEKFGGYVHLKVVPGASPEMIEKAGRYADRVSANIELPTQTDLNFVATAKKIETATTTMEQIRDKRLERTIPKTKTSGTSEASAIQQAKELSPWVQQAKTGVKAERIFAPAGQTTQMIVGATSATDATILNRTQSLYKKQNLRRVYYSAYSPIPNADATLPVVRPALIRENRLYQADWLLRFYGFTAEELTTQAEPNLSLDHDPKTSWALQHRDFFPVDVNKASREALLRIPGIGARNADRIIVLRRHRRVKLEDLRKLRVSVARARYFVVTADHNPDIWKIDRTDLGDLLSPKKDKQLSLFDDGHSTTDSESVSQSASASGTSTSKAGLLLPKKELVVQPNLVRPTLDDILAVRHGEL